MYCYTLTCRASRIVSAIAVRTDNPVHEQGLVEMMDFMLETIAEDGMAMEGLTSLTLSNEEGLVTFCTVTLPN